MKSHTHMNPLTKCIPPLELAVLAIVCVQIMVCKNGFIYIHKFIFTHTGQTNLHTPCVTIQSTVSKNGLIIYIHKLWYAKMALNCHARCGVCKLVRPVCVNMIFHTLWHTAHMTPVAGSNSIPEKVSDSLNFCSEFLFPNSVVLYSFLWTVEWIHGGYH